MIAISRHQSRYWVTHWNAGGGKTLCGLDITDDWQEGIQSEYAYLGIAKGACSNCQQKLRRDTERVTNNRAQPMAQRFRRP